MKKSKHLFSFLAVSLIVVLVMVFGVTTAEAATITVCASGCDHTTIQAAIAAASAGDTINVAAGTYVETGQIVIDKDLTIVGEDRATVIIKPNHDTTNGYYITTNGWFYVAPSTTLTLSGVTLDGAGRLIHTAIQSRGTSIISECVVKNIMYSTYLGFGIQFLDGTNNSVTDCELSNIQRVGIHVRGNVVTPTPSADLIDITYTGKGNGDWLDYAIEFGGGGSGLVDGAVITNNTGVAAADGSGSAGILATDYYGNGTVATVRNSSITGNSIGIYVGYLDTDLTELTAYNNTISGNGYGIYNVGEVMALAEDNWWGFANGPEDVDGSVEVDGTNCTDDPANEVNADGSGNEVTENIDYCPWLTEAPVPPTLVSSVPVEGAMLNPGLTEIVLEFNKNLHDEGGETSADYLGNYLLLEALGDGFQTASCATAADSGVDPLDLEITIDSAVYSDDPATVILGVNGGVALPVGTYRLYVCGTTSLEDWYEVKLNDGESDSIVNFTVYSTVAEEEAFFLPFTGFPQGKVTSLPAQPSEKAYASTEMILEIPSLGKQLSIVGVPLSSETWDVSWLGNSVGHLEGSAFPTWEGNTILTAHVWDANNNPGPFANLKDLSYGDQFYIHAFGMTYTYEVRESNLVWTNQVNKVFQHQEYDWVTLMTCEFFNPFTDSYFFRRVVGAVLISVE